MAGEGAMSSNRDMDAGGEWWVLLMVLSAVENLLEGSVCV